MKEKLGGKEKAPAAQDFHCVLCGTLPRPSGPCRSELYKHYAVRHFAHELRADHGPQGRECHDCGKALSLSSWVVQVGQVHGHVEAYLPVEARVPVVPREGRKSVQ